MHELCSSSLTWWNPSFTSSTEKFLAFASFGSASTKVGIWYLGCGMALFKSLGSIHILIFPSFMTVTMLLIQDMGLLTCLITPFALVLLFCLLVCHWVVWVLVMVDVEWVALWDVHQYDNHLVSNPYLETHLCTAWSVDPLNFVCR